MTRKRKTEIAVIAVIALILAAMILPGTEISRIETRICPTCGAWQFQTRWRFGFWSDPVVKPSPLTDWLAAHSVTHAHAWRYLGSGCRDLFGRSISAGSTGHPPPAVLLSFERLAQFLNSAPPAEVESFVHVMGVGTEEGQRQVIEQHHLRR